jgi:predicted alpha-1,6-mannanase (GH76 family)
MFNVDDPTNTKIGALRACGKAGNRPEIACTAWARSTVRANTPILGAATAMMQFYTENGLWKTTGWWNSANCLTAIIDFTDLAKVDYYSYAIDRTYEKNIREHYGNFTNEYIDDTLWWGLAWVRAFDVTGDAKYLEMAKIDSDFCYGYKDDVCGGGLWWTVDRTYKNAIPNELFIKLAAAIHNRIPGDTKYLAQAIEVWNWFRNSGMFNSDNLINDGLTSDCKNNGQVTWTYNQGVILGGLVELNRATGDANYLAEARLIADAVLRSTYLNDQNGILFEPCEHGGGDCGGDGPSFKGIFMRNLGELNRVLPGHPYSPYLEKQAGAIYVNTRNDLNQYGVHWAGPFDKADGARQHSAFEVYISTIVPT